MGGELADSIIWMVCRPGRGAEVAPLPLPFPPPLPLGGNMEAPSTIAEAGSVASPAG